MILALTQVPVGIQNAAEVACIGQTSNKRWRLEKNHSKANMVAVQRCNGRKQSNRMCSFSSTHMRKGKSVTLYLN